MPEKKKNVATESALLQKKRSRNDMIVAIFFQLLALALFVGALVGEGPFWRALRHIFVVGSRGT